MGDLRSRTPRSQALQVVGENLIDKLAHAAAVIRLRDKITTALEGGQRILDGDSHGTHFQKRMIILRVADPDAVFRGNLHPPQHGLQSTGLIDVARQDHHRTLVENDPMPNRWMVCKITVSNG
jgi:hypothetical protein